MRKRPPFTPSGVFHIYNHANGRENIFEDQNNYQFFLKKYSLFLPEVVDTLAYCLLPNHFHFIVQVKPKEALLNFYKKKKGLLTIDERTMNFHKIVQRQFTNFLGGYVNAFNLYHKRKGSLLRQNTERKVIDNRAYLKNAIHYLHYNAVHHEFVILPEEWPHTSYHAYLCDRPTKLTKTKVFKLFGGQEAFLDFHQQASKGGLADDLEF